MQKNNLALLIGEISFACVLFSTGNMMVYFIGLISTLFMVYGVNVFNKYWHISHIVGILLLSYVISIVPRESITYYIIGAWVLSLLLVVYGSDNSNRLGYYGW